MVDETDPTVIQSLAVHVADVVAAVEMTQTTDRDAVLRVTPPFAGRMRARLHVEQDDQYETEPRPLHVDPGTLLAADVPAYPRPAETEDQLRTDPEATYTVERHHERHTAAVESWRESLASGVRERATIQTPVGPHELAIVTLGDLSVLDSPSLQRRDESAE